MFETQQLRLMVSLGRTLNMTRTGKELGLTPSAVSHGLKSLETSLGCSLFERSSRRMGLTRAGDHFLTEAIAILDRMTSARQRVDELGDWRKGQLVIGATATACSYVLPHALREFRESLPDFTIKVQVVDSVSALELLERRKVDLVITTKPARLLDLNFVELMEDSMVFVVNPLHPWTQIDKLTPRDIEAANLIVPEEGSDTYEIIAEYFRDQGVRIKPFIQISSEESIKEFVRLDLGIGILPPWTARHEIAEGQLRAIRMGRKPLRRKWGILSLGTRTPTFAGNIFVGICQSLFSDMELHATQPDIVKSMDLAK